MTSPVVFAGITEAVYGIIMLLIAVFLILLVLIQRGRGGGLSGAFGGAGGQSAFGSKAGDTFTRITIVAATIWFALCLIGVKFVGITGASPFQDDEAAAGELPAGSTAEKAPGAEEGATPSANPPADTTPPASPPTDSAAPASPPADSAPPKTEDAAKPPTGNADPS